MSRIRDIGEYECTFAIFSATLAIFGVAEFFPAALAFFGLVGWQWHDLSISHRTGNFWGGGISHRTSTVQSQRSHFSRQNIRVECTRRSPLQETTPLQN